MNVPNKLTVSRFILTVAFLAVFFSRDYRIATSPIRVECRAWNQRLDERGNVGRIDPRGLVATQFSDSGHFRNGSRRGCHGLHREFRFVENRRNWLGRKTGDGDGRVAVVHVDWNHCDAGGGFVDSAVRQNAGTCCRERKRCFLILNFQDEKQNCIHVKRCKHIVHCHTPTAGKILALFYGPQLCDVEKPEQSHRGNGGQCRESGGHR